MRYDAALLYARADRSVAEELVRRLREHAVSLWWDEDLRAERTFDMRTMERIFADSEHVVVLCSESTAASGWIRQEIELALSSDKRIIPCLIGSPSVHPMDLLRAIHPAVSERQAIDLQPDGPGLSERAISVLTNTLKPLPAPSRHFSLAPSLAIGMFMAALVFVLFLATRNIANTRSLVTTATDLIGQLSARTVVNTGVGLCILGALATIMREILDAIAAIRILRHLRSLANDSSAGR